MMVEWLFLAVPWGCLQFVIVVFPDHTHYFFSVNKASLDNPFRFPMHDDRMSMELPILSKVEIYVIICKECRP